MDAPAPQPRAVGRAAVPASPATRRPTQPEVAAVAMGRATVTLPTIAAVGRAAVAPAPRPPAEITHPPSVYRATGERPEPTEPLPSNAMENSGSLTGHVLSRGHLDVPGPKSRVVVIALIITAIVAAFALSGLLIAAATSDVVSTFFDSVT